MIQFATAVVVESKGPVAIVCEIIAADAMARAIYRNVGGFLYEKFDEQWVSAGRNLIVRTVRRGRILGAGQ